MKSLFGLSENIVAALTYALGPISGLGALIFERESRFVRFHALQSTLWFLFLWVLRWAIGLITTLPFIGGILGFVLAPVFWIWTIIFVSSRLFLMFRAFCGHEFKLPYVGDVAWTQINK